MKSVRSIESAVSVSDVSRDDSKFGSSIQSQSGSNKSRGSMASDASLFDLINNQKDSNGTNHSINSDGKLYPQGEEDEEEKEVQERVQAKKSDSSS